MTAVPLESDAMVLMRILSLRESFSLGYLGCFVLFVLLWITSGVVKLFSFSGCIRIQFGLFRSGAVCISYLLIRTMSKVTCLIRILEEIRNRFEAGLKETMCKSTMSFVLL